MYDGFSRNGPVTPQAVIYAVAAHLLLGLIIWGVGMMSKRVETIIPIDLTIVPPWAQQTDDPDPDPNPPPPPEPKVDKPKPPPPKPVEEKVDKHVEAVEKVVEKPKPKKPDPPKEKPKPNLREEAKFVKETAKPPPKPNLRDEATKVIQKVLPPPTIKTTGKGTAADKPLSPEEFMKKMMEGYRIGSRNQIADNEATRCMSLITAAVRRECEKDSFKWHQGMEAILLEMSFGPGGRITGYRLLSGSGDAAMDQLVLRAVGRLGSIGGLSAPFLQQYPKVGVRVDPLQR